jgi:hypothetical protein
MDKQGKQIFIGGTGRCGTSIFSKFLGTHSQICQIPFESKFIGDKDGLLDLYTALTTNFNITQGKIAINRFEKLIGSTMNKRFSAPYIGFNLKSFVGGEYLDDILDEFIKKISSGTFVGWDKHVDDSHQHINELIRMFAVGLNKYIINPLNFLGIKNQINYKRILNKKEIMYIPRFFKEKSELQIICGSFVDSYFSKIAKNNNKLHWCEATPSNILHIDFLKTLMPNPYFIHIVRNPIGVVISMQMRKRIWAPSNIEDVCNYLIPVYEKIIYVLETIITKNTNFIQLKAEDLENHQSINDLTNFLNIEQKFNGEVVFKTEALNYWKNNGRENDISLIEKKMKKYIKYFNYN